MPLVFQVNVNGFIVFWAGIISFFSPCVLPLIPVYFSYLAGAQIGTDGFDSNAKKKLVVNTIGFLIGISFVFVMIGLMATTFGRLLYDYQEVIRKVGGLFVVLLGLNFMGLINIRFLNKDKRFRIQDYKPTFFKSLLLGFTFSFGWSPCLGSVLSPVILMAMQQKIMASLGYLLIYTIGFSIPFIVFAFLTMLGINRIQRFYKHMNTVKKIAGLLLIIMGILLYTNYFNFAI